MQELVHVSYSYLSPAPPASRSSGICDLSGLLASKDRVRWQGSEDPKQVLVYYTWIVIMSSNEIRHTLHTFLYQRHCLVDSETRRRKSRIPFLFALPDTDTVGFIVFTRALARPKNASSRTARAHHHVGITGAPIVGWAVHRRRATTSSAAAAAATARPPAMRLKRGGTVGAGRSHSSSGSSPAALRMWRATSTAKS